jgi:hypothetical protein
MKLGLKDLEHSLFAHGRPGRKKMEDWSHRGTAADRLQTDPAGRVVGLRVPAPWVGPATLMGSHGSGLKYLWGPDP